MAEMSDTNRTSPVVEEEEEVNLLEVMLVLTRRSKFILKITVCAAVISVVVSLFMRNVYTATAQLLPPQKDGGGGAAALLGQLGGLGGLAGGLAGIGGSSDLYIGILKSRSVADAVIARLDLKKELETKNPDMLRKTVAAMVKFKAGKDQIITITADHKDPQRAALLVNTFIDELQKKSLQLNLTKAGTERSFLEKRLTLVKQDLKRAEEDMKEFQEKNKTIKADTQAAAAIQGIARLKAEIITNEVKLAALRNSMTDQAPEVQTLLAGLARLKGQFAAMSGSSEGGVIPSVGSAPGLGVEYVRKMREFKTQEAIYEQLTKQYELAKLNEARDSSSIQVLDEAVAPSKKSKPKRSIIVILATAIAFIGSVIVVFIQEYLSKLSPQDSAMITEIKQSLRFRRKFQSP